MTAVQLRELASKVRDGDEIDWRAISQSNVVDMLASAQEFVEKLNEQSHRELDWIGSRSVRSLSRIGDEGPGVEADDNAESS